MPKQTLAEATATKLNEEAALRAGITAFYEKWPAFKDWWVRAHGNLAIEVAELPAEPFEAFLEAYRENP